MRYAVVTLFFAACAGELAASWREDRRWRARFKPFIVLTLLLNYYILAPRPDRLYAAALILCLAGDLLLVRRRTFYAGGAAFFLAHVFFILCYARHIAWDARCVWALPIAALCAADAVFITTRLRSHARRSAVRASVGYLATVCVMSVSAFLLSVSLPDIRGWSIFAGGALFVASDSILLIREYRKDIRLYKANFFVMLSYILSLALMTAGMARL